MPKKVYLNVEDHRVIDGGNKVEDVTGIPPPHLEHPTSEAKSSGMVMVVDVPDQYRYNAAELSISHNNGVNCHLLAAPGVHDIETRFARDVYDSTQGTTDLELVKMRCKCIHKSSEKGNIESGNPYGSTEKYSILRYEEEIGGEVMTLIDSTSGIIRINGVDYSSKLQSLLD